MNKHTYFQWLTNARNDIAARIVKLKDLAKNKPAVETPIVVGVCAMAKKALSKPMKELLSFFPADEFSVIIFEEDVILNSPIQDWPQCDCLIAFHSTGFPLDKVNMYFFLFFSLN